MTTFHPGDNTGMLRVLSILSSCSSTHRDVSGSHYLNKLLDKQRSINKL